LSGAVAVVAGRYAGASPEGAAEFGRAGEAVSARDCGDGEVVEAAVSQVAAGPVQAACADVGGNADGMVLLEDAVQVAR
jgi:hypothetical protein